MLIPHQKLNIRSQDIIKASFNYLTNQNLNLKLKKNISQKNIRFTGSARHAICQSLKPKQRVGIPAFTCSVVLDAIKNAKATPIFFDSSMIPEIKDIKKIIKEIDVLIIPHNMGFVPNIKDIQILCKQNAVELIEDCATAYGANYNQQPAGSFGDKSIFSFNISKGFFLGGAITSNHKTDISSQKKDSLYPSLQIIKTMIEGLIAQTFFNKHIFPITNKLIQNELHKKHPSLNYQMPRFALYVIQEQLTNYDQILRLRKENAEFCIKELEGVIDFVKPIQNSQPSWLYFVLLHKDRENIIKELRKEKVDIIPSQTYYDLSGKSKLAQETTLEQMIFALHRPKSEIKYIVKKIKKVLKKLET